MRSRREVGKILRASNIQVLEFHTSIIIGSGSLSFELVRSLVERLSVMIIPRWVSTEAQPITLRDVLSYLAEAIDNNAEGDQIFENRRTQCHFLPRVDGRICKATRPQTPDGSRASVITPPF